MATKIFSITNAQTAAVERLVKANSRGQVNKHLQKMFTIDTMGAVEIAELAMRGQLVVEDATAEASEPGEAEGLEGPQAGEQGAKALVDAVV